MFIMTHVVGGRCACGREATLLRLMPDAHSVHMCAACAEAAIRPLAPTYLAPRQCRHAVRIAPRAMMN